MLPPGSFSVRIYKKQREGSLQPTDTTHGNNNTDTADMELTREASGADAAGRCEWRDCGSKTDGLGEHIFELHIKVRVRARMHGYVWIF